MSKFNVANTKPASGTGPITTERSPSGVTHEGAPGYARDAKSELFLLAVSNMVGEKAFYESADTRDDRYEQLIHAVAVADAGWTLAFLRWLRDGANMRSASLVGAAEAVKARLDAAKTGEVGNGARNRQLVDAVLQRADEPGELLAYWTSRHGRAIPKPLKRGIGDAVGRLYTEYNLLKYDTASKGYRFADVIDLVHPDAATPAQGALFRYALERRHNRAGSDVTQLPMVAANFELRGGDDPRAWLDAAALKAAGMTWEDALSAVGSRVDKAELWAALIPSMGYMALLRNLRNFDQAGLPDAVAEQVAARLADPAQVARSRQFPFRFLSAYEQAPSLRWGHALDKALNGCLPNLPTLGGRTLVLVDTSGSMTSQRISEKSTVTAAKAAAVFGVALAAKGEQSDLVGFADGVFTHPVAAGSSVIREVDRFIARTGEVGHGTNIAGSLRASYRGHDRVVIISDMQTIGGGYGQGVSEAVPAHVPLYGFNLGGYQHAAFAAGRSNRHEFGGLTDATFRMIPLLEAGRNGTWPWETTA